MFAVAMGALSAMSLGVADFLASQSSERIGASKALAGMLAVSSVFMTIILLANGSWVELTNTENLTGVILAIAHGITMATALLLFFYAMSVGKISIVAPIIAAHPVGIVIFSMLTGSILNIGQLVCVALVLLGVAIVGSTGNSDDHSTSSGKTLAPTRTVIMVSCISSIIYAVAIILLQQASAALSDIPVLWLGRVFGFLTVSSIILFQRGSFAPPSKKWLWFFLLHGTLDSVGLLFILLGTTGGLENAITAVVASSFPVITVILAWVILKERLSFLQIVGAIVIFSSVAFLAGNNHG